MAITGGVRFIKSITGKHRNLIENLVSKFLADVVGLLRAFDEFCALLLHLDGVFLPHRTA